MEGGLHRRGSLVSVSLAGAYQGLPLAAGLMGEGEGSAARRAKVDGGRDGPVIQAAAASDGCWGEGVKRAVGEPG
jgi:hypothetical protein